MSDRRRPARVLTVMAGLALAASVACQPPRPTLVVEDCGWFFEAYQPSQWETEWHRAETSGERHDVECEVLATPTEVDRSVRLIRAVQDAVLRRTPVPPASIDLFSRMVYGRRCGPDRRDTGARRTQLIEPLIGILRDPLTICPRPPGVPDDLYDAFGRGENNTQSKRHLLIGSAAPWSEAPDRTTSWRIGGFEPWAADVSRSRARRARLNYLVDMGASTYSGWAGSPGAVGALWFVDRYGRHNLTFDWIISFEYEKHDPDDIYRDVPDDILPHYIYFNKGVEKDPASTWNPWRILRGMGVTSGDYLVVKLDIDTPDIENALVDQLIHDAGLQALVDEMFFEHHVNTKPMWPKWGLQDSPLRLTDTYRNFTALRSKGIRMHSWP